MFIHEDTCVQEPRSLLHHYFELFIHWRILALYVLATSILLVNIQMSVRMYVCYRYCLNNLLSQTFIYFMLCNSLEIIRFCFIGAAGVVDAKANHREQNGNDASVTTKS